MAANIVFVDEGTTDEVFGGEESDLDENMNNSERRRRWRRGKRRRSRRRQLGPWCSYPAKA